VIVPVWLAALGWRGSWRALRRKSAATVVGELLTAVAAATVAATTLVFLARLPLNRSLLLGYAALSLPALVLSRTVQAVVLRTLRRRAFDPHRIVVVGPGEAAAPLQRALAEHPEWGTVVHRRLGHAEVEALAEVLVRDPVDEVFLVGPWPAARLVPLARLCDEVGVPLSLEATFLGPRVERAELQQLDGWTALTFRGAGPTVERLLKRALDVGVASVGLVLAAPLLAALAILIRAADGGPPLFVQERAGQYGRSFRMFKLRTMVPDAEARQRELAAHNEVDGPAFKLTDDPRITGVGRWLRRLSLDELPQLVNVLRGEMSLVGPRPPLPSEVARYERWQLRRLSVRPGMTGLWQVSGRGERSFEAWIDLDLQYIDRWSLWLDLVLLARTVPAVLRGTGAR
jgi:exopolysaccharide biosynthesis polyprenyl glycosylphosphotransferase